MLMTARVWIRSGATVDRKKMIVVSSDRKSIKGKRRHLIQTFCGLAMMVFSSSLFAQSAPIGPGGYSQDFDTLSPVAGSWTNDSTLAGWYAFQQTGTLTAYAGNNGTSTTGGLYSYGNSSDRSLGALAQSGESAGHIVFGVSLQNTSGDSLPVNLSYVGKQWRAFSDSGQSLTFSYQVTSTALTSSSDWDPSNSTPSGWTSLSSIHSALLPFLNRPLLHS